jgi:hypothetical protein
MKAYLNCTGSCRDRIVNQIGNCTSHIVSKSSDRLHQSGCIWREKRARHSRDLEGVTKTTGPILREDGLVFANQVGAKPPDPNLHTKLERGSDS